jgi:site-specific DNA-methyltransferase (adenine-specific)
MLKINRIYNEDCLIGMLKIPDASIDMILADLPYGQTASKWDVMIPFDLLWEHYKRILKENGVVILTTIQPFTTMAINSNPSWFRYVWYWEKNQGTNFFHAKRMPIRKIEEILIFYKKQPTYNPQMTKGHLPTNSAKGCYNGRVYHGKNRRNYQGGSTIRYPTNILRIKCVNNYERLHPNQKPVELFKYLIKTYTHEDDLILDNVIGSGTTALACLETQRNFIGFEKVKEYFDIACKRIANYVGPS